MKKRAYAKINLSLDVIGKREDGYHDLEMVMVPLQLHDLVEITIDKEDSFTSNISYLKYDSENTIYKVIQLMREKYDFKEHFKIHLNKIIPTQAGLAGGSSDGAATIHLINDLLKLNLSIQEMEEIADKIGKDVVFCLHQKSALVTGAGENIEFVTNNLDCHVVLVKPKGGVSTKLAYGNLTNYQLEHFQSDNVLTALKNNDFNLLCQYLGNTFEPIAFDIVPEISKIKRALLEMGFSGVLMSGSGSCVFALTLDENLANEAVKKMRKKYPFAWTTRIMRDNNEG